MKLSSKVRYGTRALLDLAVNYKDKPVLLKDIAKRQEISKKYLERIFSSLKAAGLVKSLRGAKGGFVLNKQPSEITVYQIFEVLEGPLNLVECVKSKGVCKRSTFCVAIELWRGLNYAIEKELNSITLEELVSRERQKRKISASMYQI